MSQAAAILTATHDELRNPATRPYQPHGAALRLMTDRAPEILLSGPAGTGKTRAALEKMHLCAERYPGSRLLILRKTRASLTESALVTWEEHVVPQGHATLTGPKRPSRRAYVYPNGSVVVVGGLDSTTRIMSTEYSLIFVQEAIELTESEWESLTSRLRHAAMPYRQIIGDTNPDRPSHWLKQRCDSGQCRLNESRHEDNPALWDAAANAWTQAGAEYLARLNKLTGPRLQRLRYGRWVQAEGVVYDGWDAAAHVIDRFPIPPSWPRYLAVDFGYTNPFVCQWWAQDPDGRLYLYREIYHTQRLVEDHAKYVKNLGAGEPRPLTVVCDTDAEDRATLERYLGMTTTPAVKDVSPGIQAVAGRLRAPDGGKPRLFVMRDSLVERDPGLVESKLPACILEEIDGYVWDTRAGKKKGEEPVKNDDHGMDAMRYMVMHLERGRGPAWASRRRDVGRNAADAMPPGVFG